MITTALPEALRVEIDRVVAPKEAKAIAFNWAKEFKSYRKGTDMERYGRGLLLSGPDEAVNRRLAGAVGYQCRVLHWTVPTYVEIETWVRLNKSLWDRQANNEGDLEEANAALNRIRRAELLIIDGLGREQKSDWTRSEIPALIDARWTRGRPTVVTTQLPMKSLLTQYTHTMVFDHAFLRVGVVEATRAKG